MKKTRHAALAALRPVAAALALAGTLGAAHAAGYPDQPITVVVPYSAGGGADNAARIIAQGMGEVAGQSVVIENKGGASGSIGAAYVARAKPDGYTVLYDASAFSINPVLRKLPYDAKKDFIPVSQAVSVPNILVAATGSAFNSLPDFIKAARANPGRYTYASYGPGSLAQMAAELLKKDAKIDVVHVPYKGGAPAIVDVMGGQVDVYFANAASSLNYVSTGKLKALAVSSAARMPDLPNVPTVSEGGVNAFDVVEWNGFFLPAGADPQVVAKLQDLVQKALARPETRDKLAKLGLTPVGSSAADFAKFVDAEQVRWAEVVKTNNITVN
ncbi:tripartite tricarboxylate transporter substrate binding protein [Achromobacter xylosoxidans]|uniref:tripartite tricarboxylate transporter substrate binding protein n=1 Tax=Alcaligenes xylosoxydans xylosoxydans TaxID=85698 RepID=UPI0006C38251|nr:tripartite tricarboxylate transporter substrate binding protein [Achromobacter xylosoxidans]MCZ8437120.1 tripartite tricarboxylate transporter substrate binding protein [Achromobacter xylosoxidans]MDC6161680.1 tripartite tricarboxylate transporter substrate binding protein [Achromobacter xylosoxidans]CUI34253.1 Argininosuccinate lyase [Achromobacter xylosoxidans]CUJ85983.1 Argininosuccinate lyase [Achromobacter xylosoxidans]